MKVLLVSAALVAAALCAAPAPPPGWTPLGRLLLVPAHLEAYPPPAEYPQTTVQPEVNGTQVTQESESDETQSENLLESGENYVLLPDGLLQMVKFAIAALKTEENAPSDAKEPQNDQGAQDNGDEQQRFRSAYYIQAQEEQNEPSAQYNAQGPYEFQEPQFQPAAFYIQAQEEQKEQSAQYNAQGPLKFQPAAYPVFIQLVSEQSESAQYDNTETNFLPQYPVYQKSSQSNFQQVKQEPSNFQIDLVQYPLQVSEQFSQTKLQLSEPKSAQNMEEKDEETSGYEANVQYRDVKPISAPIYAFNPTPLVRILKK